MRKQVARYDLIFFHAIDLMREMHKPRPWRIRLAKKLLGKKVTKQIDLLFMETKQELGKLEDLEK